MPRRTYDAERPDLNVVRYKKHGQTFEVVVNPDLVLKYRRGEDIDIEEVLRSQRIYSNASRNLVCLEGTLEKTFETLDRLEIANKILHEGAIQFTAEQREHIRQQKQNKIVDNIAKNTGDPRTGAPHPRKRIEKAINEYSIHVDPFEPAKNQVKRVIEELRTHFPITTEQRTLTLTLDRENAYNVRPVLDSFGDVENEEWGNQQYRCVITVSAGQYKDLLNKVNSMTHGEIQIDEHKDK